MNFPIMAHLVMGYPSLAESLRSAEQYIASGCRILELQIPFSHPTADGPVITQACREAVEREQTRVEDCLDLLATLRQRYPEQEIMLMSYTNRIYHFGLKKFAAALLSLGVKHLIVPDLPVDSPIARQLEGITLVPVLAANVGEERLARLIDMDFDFYYLMSDFKITGSTFSLHPQLARVIAAIRTGAPQARIGIGFGISTPEQVRVVAQHADVAIVGSALIQAQQRGHLSQTLQTLVGYSAS
ncbi:MAG: tryptophan synthase subunit alpha [Chitinophagales bacterium]|nr:tryptophan synthase subunit alpha [Chitinophagales bacterium]